jgi:glycosyltransferase involved in cell wall biosynthesis
MAKKIKICIASIYAYDLFFPDTSRKGRIGGAELQLYNFATKIAEDDRFEVHFFTANFQNKKRAKIKNVNVYNIFDVSKFKIVFNFIKLYFVLNKIKFDICVQRSAGIETGLMALYCRIKNKKFVYMTANDKETSLRRPNHFGSGFLQKIRWSLFEMGIKRSALIFSQNSYQKEELLRNYKKESVIRKSAHFIGDFKENLQKKYILWVGRSDRGLKNPEAFLDMARELEEFDFLMICQKSADIEYFREIKEKAESIKNLKFLDYVPFSEIKDYFSRSFILINTSSSEGFPNTFIDAFKFGAVVFSLKVNPDNILDDKMGFCFNGDFDKMKRAVRDSLKNKDILIKSSRHAYAYAKDNHDIERIIKNDKDFLFKINE